MPAARPNILWIVTTQWRGQAGGFAGDPNARTPHLDAFAARAAVFERAFSNHPFGPFARALLLSGKLSPANGVRDYWDPLPRDTRTIAHHLAAAGYHTAYFGKWHLAPRDPLAPVVGEAHARQLVAPEDRGGFSLWEGFEGGFLLNDPFLHGTALPEPTRFPGYQADVVCARAAAWLRAHNSSCVDGGLGFTPACGTGLANRELRPVAPPGGAGFTPAIRTSASQPVAAVAQSSGPRTAIPHSAFRTPHFVVVSLESPHPPYGAATPPDLAPRDPAALELAPNVPRGGEVETTARRELAGYYRHLEATDRAIGRLLAQIDLDTTAVFITSAHGDMHGAHGLFRKGWPYEESIRVPLLASWPGAAPQRIRTPVSLADLPATALALAGTAAPADWPGGDLRSLAPDAERAIPLGMPSAPPFEKQCPHPWHGVRTRDELRTFTADGSPWLHFDLPADPWQHRNLAADPTRLESTGPER
ncbi:MAG: sulfatase-like hydrolase/transferase [Opitutaceae bacterium]|nr:sulfatase-like hydrolase/transferase [Opitutaceae bacterium]